MKLKITLVTFILFLSQFQLAGAADKVDSTVVVYEDLEPGNLHPRLSQGILMLLSRNHYKNKKIDDALSSEMFDVFIESLDNSRMYFLQSDIDKFEKYRNKFDNFLKAGNLNRAYDMFNVFQQRFKERQEFAQLRLKQEFDFSLDEDFEIDRRESPWATSKAELDEIWRKRLKNDALRLKLAGKEWEEISKTLCKRYSNIAKRVGQTNSEDVFQIYMNAFTETFDPHTGYMSPANSDNFKIRMSKSLEGIGASLSTQDEYTKVMEIIPGGPADKSGLLHKSDLISAVGQGSDGEMVDVIGWRIDDVVDLIRGPKATRVRLQIIPADAGPDSPQDTIEIVRDKVRLADRAAKSDTLEVEHLGKTFRIGVIEIPDFYLDYDAMRKGDKDYASTTRDVQRIIRELKSAEVDGIVIDLRHNGGGFLNEAIELTGLFIKDGPVVQVRNVKGSVNVERDYDSNIYYEGPLAVMVNRFSASASEIFAAAIQDYGRGIVVGGQTYGKGTVQNVIQLKRVFPTIKEKLGQLKLTIAKFYRINGGSTQHVGVMPDIEFPSRYEVMEIGESNQENALLWDEIDAVSYRTYSDNLNQLIPRLQASHVNRVKENNKFQYLLEDIAEIKKDREKKSVSLFEEKRLALKKENEEKKARRKELDAADGSQEKDEDIFVAETAHILSDLIMLQEKIALR